MQPNIGIKPENLSAVSHILSGILADEFLLYTKTRNAHWNVEGPDFYDKHKMFEDQYNELAGVIDEAAERIRMIGHYAPGSLQEFLDLTELTESPRESGDSKAFIKELLADHETIATRLREQIGPINDKGKDIGTADFLTGVLRMHEKMAWMLRAHL